MKQVLVLYVPAIHQGYIKLFEKYKGADLYIIDEDIINEFPLSKREIRSIKPEVAKRLIEKASYFDSVRLASSATLQELVKQDTKIILSTEYISDFLVSEYFSDSSVEREPVFLRYDESTVKNARKEVDFDGTVTEDKFHKELLAKALEIKEKSADYFLQVGALIIPQQGSLVAAPNTRMPAPHEMHSVGDPRNYMPYGTDTRQRTTLHAEQTAIAQAAKLGIKTEGASIYATTFPCPDCCNNIAEAGIKKVYFKDGYSELSSDETLKAYGVEIIKVI